METHKKIYKNIRSIKVKKLINSFVNTPDKTAYGINKKHINVNKTKK